MFNLGKEMQVEEFKIVKNIHCSVNQRVKKWNSDFFVMRISRLPTYFPLYFWLTSLGLFDQVSVSFATKQKLQGPMDLYSDGVKS